jgi:hypothetical protein
LFCDDPTVRQLTDGATSFGQFHEANFQAARACEIPQMLSGGRGFLPEFVADDFRTLALVLRSFGHKMRIPRQVTGDK